MALRTWLQSRKKETILKKTVEHMQKVLETVHEFERAFSFFALEKKSELAYKVLQRVLDLEHEADNMRREILIITNQSDMGPKMREDLMNITKRIDRIADEADHAARRIMGINPDQIRKIGDEALDSITNLIHKTVETTKLLFNLIKRLAELTNEEVFHATEQIQKYEHECDKLHSMIYRIINKKENIDMNPFVAIQISQFVDMIEAISNRVEDVADYIEILQTLDT